MAAVDVPGLRKAAEKLTSEDGGPIVSLMNTQTAIEETRLSGLTLSVFGSGAVAAHNQALERHLQNVKGGIEKVREIATKLNAVADNWAKSDQDWVVKK
ncbi:hypothetical protein AB0M43_26260 [Longispora sp. NPDC051575]|uniref:hypothetical protein n=1 Tax=Longispora sp. NPDC051575 TaxID=3154943 RepID=UPI00342FB085